LWRCNDVVQRVKGELDRLIELEDIGFRHFRPRRPLRERFDVGDFLSESDERCRRHCLELDECEEWTNAGFLAVGDPDGGTVEWIELIATGKAGQIERASGAPEASALGLALGGLNDSHCDWRGRSIALESERVDR
jgi:hypothetical protein